MFSIFPMNVASSIWKCLEYEVVPKGLYAPIGRARYYGRKISTARKISNHSNHNGRN